MKMYSKKYLEDIRVNHGEEFAQRMIEVCYSHTFRKRRITYYSDVEGINTKPNHESNNQKLKVLNNKRNKLSTI